MSSSRAAIASIAPVDMAPSEVKSAVGGRGEAIRSSTAARAAAAE